MSGGSWVQSPVWPSFLFNTDVVFWCCSEGKGIISKLVDLLVKA